MTEHDEDEVWRAIVDNYGERAQLTDGSTGDTRDDVGDEPAGAVAESPAPTVAEDVDDDPALDRYFPVEHFTPPPVTRPSRPAPARLAAWLGVFGVPAALLLSVVLDVYVPQLVGLLMLAWFVGGFGYLVWSMPRGPREPWDDGAQV